MRASQANRAKNPATITKGTPFKLIPSSRSLQFCRPCPFFSSLKTYFFRNSKMEFCALFEGFLVLPDPPIRAKISFGSAIPQQIPMRQRRLDGQPPPKLPFSRQWQGDPKPKIPKNRQTPLKPALAHPSHPRKPMRRLDGQTASKAFFFPQRQGERL